MYIRRIADDVDGDERDGGDCVEGDYGFVLRAFGELVVEGIA